MLVETLQLRIIQRGERFGSRVGCYVSIIEYFRFSLFIIVHPSAGYDLCLADGLSNRINDISYLP